MKRIILASIINTLLVVFICIAFSLLNLARAEFLDIHQSIGADFNPEMAKVGSSLYEINLEALCDIANPGAVAGTTLHSDSQFIISSPDGSSSSYSDSLALNATGIKLYCDLHAYDDWGNILTQTRQYTYIQLVGSYQCPSSLDPSYKTLGISPYFLENKCYKPLECEAPFKAEATIDNQGIEMPALCKTYCPQNTYFDYALGRCDLKRIDTNQCDALKHNPINSQTGEKLQTFNDFSISGQLLLSFSRNYGSLRAPEQKGQYNKLIDIPNKNTFIQPNGYTTPNTGYYQNMNSNKQGDVQWRHNYQLSLSEYDTNKVEITLANREQRLFTKIENDYQEDFPIGGKLEQNASQWIYTNKHSIQYIFDLAGRLIEISNQSGEQLTLTYNIANQLIFVTNLQGQQLTYAYNSDGLLTVVTQPDENTITLSYDSANNLTLVTYPDGATEHYHYEDNTHPYALTGITDSNNVRYASWQYNAIGQAIDSTHALGANNGDVIYDNMGRKITSSNSLNNETTVEFGIYGNVSKVTGDSCSTSGVKGEATFAYDSYGRVTSKTDENGNTETFTYIGGKVASHKVASGTPNEQHTHYTYSDYATPTQIILPNGSIVTNTLDVNGRIESTTAAESGDANAETRTTIYTYNAAGLIASIDGSRTDVVDITTFTYDANNFLSTVTNALSQATIFENYDGFGNATKMTDSNGVVTNLTYDLRGRLTSIEIAGRTTSFDYDGIGQLTKVTEPNGNFLIYTFDDARRLTAITNNVGESISFTYDSEGNVTSQTIKDSLDSIKFSQQMVYDQISRLSQTISATNQTWTNEYDVGGNLVKQISPDSTEIESAFDALKRATSHIDQADKSTGFEYNKHNQLTKVTDALNRETTYAYNGFGEIVTQVSQDTSTTAFTYNEVGNLVTKTDARGVITTYSYDALNRITGVMYSDSADTIAYTYDSNDVGRYGMGKLTSVTSSAGTTQYYYSAYGELIKEEVTPSGASITYTIEYSYNSNGQLASITYPSSRVISYTHNASGQITTVTSTLNTTNETLASNISYLPFGGISGLIYGNGKTLSQTYNNNYQLTNKQVTNLIDKVYGYDLVNNIDIITDNNETADSQSFTYDTVSRLLTASGNYGDFSYAYDAIGNRLTKTQDTNITNYVYQNNSQLTSLTGSTTATMTYDAMGNLLSKGGDVFTYDSQARLNSATVNSVTTQYQYNHMGQRVMKGFANGDTRYFVYDIQGLLIAELNELGETHIEYVYVNGQRIAILITSLQTVGNVDEFYITNVESGLKLKASANTEQSLMVMADARDETNWVKFTQIASSGGHYYLKNIETGFYFSPVSKNNDAVIEQRLTSDDGQNTQWKKISLSGEQVLLKNRWAKDYLQIQTGTIGEDAVINDSSSSVYVAWEFTPTLQTQLVTDTFYVHTNHLDAPLALSDSNANTVWQASYSPFGEITVTTDTLVEIFKARFPGQYSDNETGFYYNYFRDYDPELGRYIQSDPIGLAGGINTYGYVGGNPVNFIDPDGRKRCSPQQARDLGLSQSNCWIGTDDIEGKCVTAECAAGVLPNPKRTDKQACYAICLGMGQAEGKSLDKFLKAKADNYNAKACEGVNANIKRNKVLEKAGAAGKLLGLATTGQCLKLCNDSFN